MSMKVYAVKASVGGTYLILSAYSLSKEILFHMYSFRGKSALVAPLILERVKCMEQSHSERRTRTQTSTRG